VILNDFWRLGNFHQVHFIPICSTLTRLILVHFLFRTFCSGQWLWHIWKIGEVSADKMSFYEMSSRRKFSFLAKLFCNGRKRLKGKVSSLIVLEHARPSSDQIKSRLIFKIC